MDRTVTSPQAVGFSSGRLSRIKPLLQAYADRHGLAGIGTMIARRGQVMHSEQIGWQDRESQVPLSPDTIFRIYSMTKPIVCAAFMTLFEEGRFQLSDPLAKFLPAFGKVRVHSGSEASGFQEVDLIRPITLRDLMTHTAGLTYDFLMDSPVCEMYRQARIMSDPDRTLEATIREVARLPLAFQPGTRWHYSVAIDVIGYLIEVVSGQPLQEFLSRRIFAPLGMADTGFSVPTEKRERISVMYGYPDLTVSSAGQITGLVESGHLRNERRDVEATNPSTNTGTFARGGHGLFSTAWDYLRFAQMLLNRGDLDGSRILAPKTVDLMYMNHLPPALLPFEQMGATMCGYGFGLGSRVLMNVAEAGVPGSVGEFGGGGAAATGYWVDPQEKLTGVIMLQFMACPEKPLEVFRNLAYQALVA